MAAAIEVVREMSSAGRGKRMEWKVKKEEKGGGEVNKSGCRWLAGG